MLQLDSNNIRLNQSSNNKLNAIKSIAADLTEKGLVQDGYIDGMLNRESQNSTFLGNGIAIPHGTTDTRGLVQQTGIALHHFPDGVDWGDGNTAYVAIGIAAKSDEHLGILQKLTSVLSADGVEQKLKQAKTANEIIALLNGDTQITADFNPSLIQLNFSAVDMTQMAAVTGGLLKNNGGAGPELVADLVSKTPAHLGKGLWLVGSDKSVSSTGMAFISTGHPFKLDGSPVKALIAFGACNNAHAPMLDKITELVFKQEQDTLLSFSAEQLLRFFTGESAQAEESPSGNVAVFTIVNPHGLHARPGAMLVAEAKKFQSEIKVSNLHGDGKAVDAKNLMKLIGLGVRKGSELQFSAEGPDAAEALESIGKLIASGLGENLDA